VTLPENAARWLVVVLSFGDKHIDQAANPAGDGCSPLKRKRRRTARIVLRRHRIEQLAAHQ